MIHLQKDYSFSIDEVDSIPFSDYDENEYAVARLRFLSDRPNSHGIIISKEVLREYASTALGAWVIADIRNDDASTHTSTQNIYGFVPREQEVKFEDMDDGYTYAIVDAVISKRYGKDYYDIFKNYNHRSVSVEATFSFEEGDENTAVAFDVKAITTLGLTVRPSVPGADTELIRFSEQEAENAYKKFSEESLTTRVEKIEKKLGIVPDGKEDDKMENKDIINETEELEKLEEVESKEEPEKMEEDPKPETEEDKDDDSDDKADDSEEEMSCGDKMSEEEMQSKIDELSRQVEEKENIIMDKDKELSEKEAKFAEMETELSELREYKKAVVARENAVAVDAFMEEVKPFVDAEKFAEFKEEGLACTEDGFDAWKNKVQAVCFANVSKKLKKDDLGVFTFAAPVEKEPKKFESVWDRIKSKNNI